VRIPAGERGPIFSKSMMEPIVSVFLSDGAKAAFFVLIETSFPHCAAQL
jgi:hypothetical protein